MANQYVNKVVINGVTKIDISGDTAVANKVLKGYTFHTKNGAPATGTCEFDANTSADTATDGDILSGATAHVKGALVTGAMVNNEGWTGTISTKAEQKSIPVGYHDGSGHVSISSTEQAKIIAGNIKSGIQILGVTGSYTGRDELKIQAKTATPTFSSQTITPDSTFDYLSQVTVNPIPVTYVDNASGGQTCTVG